MPFLSDWLLKGEGFEAVGEKYYLSYPIGGRFENVVCVAEISPCRIVLQLKKGKLGIFGEGLEIRSYCVSDVTVSGKITRVERLC